MDCRKVWLFLWIMIASSSAVVDEQSYIIHMDTTKMPTTNPQQWYTTMIDSLNQISSLDEEEESNAAKILYVYKTAISGFAAKLSTKGLNSLSKIPGFLAATPNELLQLHTSHSPQFLGLQRGHGLWNSSNLASDTIIGVLDTGIWPEHISFQDKGLPHVPTKWKGICQSGPKFSRSNCNKKLIGARAYIKGYEAVVGRLNATGTFRSPRDSHGHGTHTASTAAGNMVDDASFYNQGRGVAMGIRFTSRIAAYKVCWPEGCASADILAAMDQAVADGVDVLSLSLGGGAGFFYRDDIAIASFGAVRNGVFVSCSAGNSGPFTSTVGNVAPWIMTVAASYTDRTFPTTVKLGNGKVFEGSSLYSGNNLNQPPLVYNNTAGNGEESNLCTAGSLVKSMVKGKIVVCERGINSRTAKGEQVKLAGGLGMILSNTQFEGREELFADSHVLPATTVGASAGKAIIDYIKSSKRRARASISFEGTRYGSRAPRVAAFSSRGPSFFEPEVIKPDVTAPGVNILAAWPSVVSPSELESDKRRVLFNIISGTSMSCPHVSGLAALLKSAHKDWSPAAIKSALMTTAYVTDNKKRLISDVGSASAKPADPFAFGSGHVDPEKAYDPGLVYDIAPEDYLNYLCSLKYNSTQIALVSRGNFTCPSKRKILHPGDLNYPSFSVFIKKKTKKVTVTRTVTNVGSSRSDYTIQINNPKGVKIDVKPKKLSFRKLGEKLSYKVSFVPLRKKEALSEFSFGSLVWISGKYVVRSPIAVTWEDLSL